MDDISNTQTSPLTPEQLAIVVKIHKDNGILTVRDRMTSDACGTNLTRDPPAYGTHFTPESVNQITGRRARSTVQRKMRVIETWFTDSTKFPGGIPVGVIRIEQRYQLSDMVANPKTQYEFVSAKTDMSFSQQKQIKSYCFGKRWMSDAERKADEDRKEMMRMRRQDADIDPVEATSAAVQTAIAEGLKEALSAVRDSTPIVVQNVLPDEGGVRPKIRIVDIDGARRRRWFVEDTSGEQFAGPYRTEEEAQRAITEMDRGDDD